MNTLPRPLVDLLLALPDEEPVQVTLNYNGHGQWQVEVTRKVRLVAQHLEAVALAALIDTRRSSMLHS
jgi:hypothetical protein